MTTTPTEPVSRNDRLNEALIGFTGCLGEAVTDVCSYGLTVGQDYVPFDPDEDDEDCDDEGCSQLWVRVTQVTPVSIDQSFGGNNCMGVELRIGLEVGIIRCFEMNADGEAPTASQVLTAATTAMDDMLDIQCAALGCEVWQSIDVGQWVPYGPLGGQYGGIWTFTAEV